MMSSFPLTAENYTKGFLVDDEVIAGVTEMAGGVYAAYVSHYLTGETLAYEEFPALAPALGYLAARERPWVFEGIGCKGGGCKAGGCGASGCGGGCGAGSCQRF